MDCVKRFKQDRHRRTPTCVIMVPPQDGGSLQPLRAGVAFGKHKLPPITPVPPQQQQPCSSSSSLPAVVRSGPDPVLMNLLLGDRLPKAGSPRLALGKKNLAGLDRAHPLKPLHHPTTQSGVASGGMAPAPPAVTKATDKRLKKSKKMKARRSLKTVQDGGLKSGHHDNSAAQSEEEQVVECGHDSWTLLRQEALDLAEEIRLASLRCSSALQTAKPQAASRSHFHSRQTHLKKATSLNVPTAVTGDNLEEQVAEWTLLRQEALDLAEEIRFASLRCSSALSGDASILGRTGSSVGSLSPVDLRTPSVLRALPFLRTPTPPTAPTLPAAPAVPSAPAPLQTAKPQAANHSQYHSGLARQKKATSLNVATAVTEHKSEESVEAGKTEIVRESKEVKKKPVRVVKQTSKPQQTRELPELAKLPPVACPEQAVLQAFRLLNEDDWEQKIKALISIRSLSQHHAEVLLPRLHDICLAVNREVKNLRSMVSRAAMETLAHLHAHLGRDMDAEAEGTAQTLLPKAGEASKFIKEDVELGLGYMVLSVSPSRSMNALINAGLRHRNAAVRKVTAQHLEKLAEVMGASRVLCGKKDLTDRFIQSISYLAIDSAQEVRTHARNTLAFLASHPDLLKMVDKFVPQRDQATIRDVISKSQKRYLH